MFDIWIGLSESPEPDYNALIGRIVSDQITELVSLIKELRDTRILAHPSQPLAKKQTLLPNVCPYIRRGQT